MKMNSEGCIRSSPIRLPMQERGRVSFTGKKTVLFTPEKPLRA
ncbi:MAG: hypothetical protein ABF876_08305 [Acetobacter aceti]|nr:hypothetical protein [Acetobacter aceti]